ncbi:MAG: hypothetical protein KGJ60_14745, partial [Verrucomicrobiota bacterium]|nr:hypothetical protein [Verrucomicrobiota bacterium]
FTAKCSTLTERFRYTSDTVFDTSPWPQFGEVGRAAPRAPSGKSKSGAHGVTRPTSDALERIRAVAEAARALRQLRREIMDANGWSLRELYKSLETPGENRLRDAHAALNDAVRSAYGMKPDEDSARNAKTPRSRRASRRRSCRRWKRWKKSCATKRHWSANCSVP